MARRNAREDGDKRAQHWGYCEKSGGLVDFRERGDDRGRNFGYRHALEAGLAVNIFVAWMLIFAAVAHFVFAWFTRRTGSVLLKVLLGILYLCVAIYLLDHPARGLATLTLAMAFYC